MSIRGLLLKTYAYFIITIQVIAVPIIYFINGLIILYKNLIQDYKNKIIYPVINIPGPSPSLPLFGTRWIYNSPFAKYDLSKLLEVYHEFFNQYGETFREYAFGNIMVVHTKNIDAISEVIKDSNKYPLRPSDGFIDTYRSSRPDRFNSVGLIHSQGLEWLKLRKASTSDMMNSQVLRNYIPELRKLTDDTVLLIHSKIDSNGYITNFKNISQNFALEASCLFVLGERMGCLHDDTHPKINRLKNVLEIHFEVLRDAFYGLPLWKVFPTTTYKKMVQAEEEIYDIVSEFLDPLIESNKEIVEQDTTKKILLSILHNKDIDIKDKKACIVDLISAGIHTTGTGLAILLHYLAVNEFSQEKLYQEIKGIDEKDVKDCHYLRACFKESCRLLPVAPAVARLLEKPLKCGDFMIPEWTPILFHFREACLDEKNFINATKFLPERWIPEAASALGLTPKYPYLCSPFGFSRRICPGKKTAELEVLYLTAKIIENFHVTTDKPIDVEFNFIIQAKGDMPFTFTSRNNK